MALNCEVPSRTLLTAKPVWIGDFNHEINSNIQTKHYFYSVSLHVRLETSYIWQCSYNIYIVLTIH